MQPNIALTYNSQSGNGPVGVGWSISGLSSIYRCNLTYAQDAAPAPIALATSDGYCMDGQRLRLTGGTYGAAGSTYQTEVANFINVTAYSTAGNGPAYFVAKDRNGKSYTYGNTVDSKVLATGTATPVSWMLNEVSDPSGNTMTVTYSQTTGTAVPATISWTPSAHGSSTYNYTMTFAYGTNVAPPQGYVAGTVDKNPNLLSSITINYSGATVKKYVLTYQASATTGRDTLTQVKECSDSGATNCLSPTAITYQSGTAGLSTTATALSHPVTLVHYDFNHDGYPDLLYVSGSTTYVSFGSASGFGTGINTGIPSTAAQLLVGDLTGNGQDRILAAVNGTWYYYTWNGSAFTQTSTGLAYDSTAQQYLLADVNGDGLPDLVASYYSAVTNNGIITSTVTINVRLNTGAGSSVSFGSAIQSYQLVSNLIATSQQLVSNTDNAGGQTLALGSLRRFDFNGDGRDDLAMQLIFKNSSTCGGLPPSAPQGGSAQPLTSCVYTDKFFELISTGTTSSPTLTSHLIYSAPATTYASVSFLDFNSDACTDYLVFGTIYVAGCDGSTPASVTLPNGNVIGAMDWNGDGLTDILVANGSTVGVYPSTGSGVGSLISTSIPYNSGYSYFTLDANADGLDDFAYWNGTSTYYYLHNGAGTPPDLVTAVTDGFGNSVTSTYVSLTQHNYSATGYSTPSYPYQNYIGPMYVVSQAVLSDPSSSSGGTYNQTYWYYEAFANIQGRGWQAFYAMRTADSRTSLLDYKYYEQTFPATGMLWEELSSNGSFYPKQSYGTLQTTTLSSTQYQQRYFPHFSNSTTLIKEVSGSEKRDADHHLEHNLHLRQLR